MRNRLAWFVCALALATGAPTPGSSLSMEAVSGKGPLSANPSSDSAGAPSGTATATPAPIAAPAIDSSDLKQLPPRTLPLKQQMMFAGGFMAFLALMLTSMQNLNPND